MLSPAGPVAVVEGCQHRDAGLQSGDDVAMAVDDSDNVIGVPAGQCGQTGTCRNDVGIRHPVLTRTGVTHPGHRHVDDVRVELPQLFVAEPHLVHDRRAEILDHDVGVPDQVAQYRKALCGSGIECDAALVAVDVVEVPAGVRIVVRSTRDA